MNRQLLLTTAIILSCTITNLQAQDWRIGGNEVTGNVKLGTTNNKPVKFITNDNFRGIITRDGLWGFGDTIANAQVHIKSKVAGRNLFQIDSSIIPKVTVNNRGQFGIGTGVPIARLQVEGANAEDALRVRVGGLTRLMVHSSGGVSVGSSSPAPTDGLFVRGNTGIGTNVPNSKLHVNSDPAQNPLRVQVNGVTKFQVNNTGGASIGNDVIPPPNGLHVSGNTGMGIFSPLSRLHVFNGASGVAPIANTTLTLENSFHNYLSMLTPGTAESGILFGNSSSAVSGGIIYNSFGTSNGLQFRTNGNVTRMSLTNNGDLGIGIVSDGYKLKIRHDFFGLNIENSTTGNDWEMVIGTDGSNELELWYNSQFRGAFNDVTGTYAPISDERLKANIKPMNTMLQKIMQLKPSSYQFKNAIDKKMYDGFIAQEVAKVFPNLVNHVVFKERKLDVYTLDYSGFGVLAIKGIQELVKMNEDLKKENTNVKAEVENLKSEIDELRKIVLKGSQSSVSSKQLTGSSKQPVSLTSASLEQNVPNPFTNTTTIHYTLPEKFLTAQMVITDKIGKTIKQVNVSGAGKGSLNIDASALISGAYNYSLIVDGKMIGTKQMVLTK